MNFEDFIAEHGVVKTVPSQEHIFVQGDHDSNLYYLQSGLLKAYYLSLEGKETIKSFLRPGDLIGSLSACYRAHPCSFSLVALKDTSLLRVPFEPLFEASRDSQPIALFVIEKLLELAMKKELREYELLALSAEDRFRALREREPELLQAITQNDMARYLGITPVALSRIKSRLDHRKS